LFRSLAFALFAACLGLAALPGCGNPAPKGDKKDEKKDEKKDDTRPNPGGDPKADPKPDVPPKTTLGAVEKGAEDVANAFRRDLIQGTPKAEMLSSAFLKAVGRPAVLPSDKARGYSADEAVSWLRKVVAGVNFGPEMKRDQVGDVAYLCGAVHPHGSYCLRLVKEGGAWKVDWLSISSVEGTVAPAPTPDGVAQGFVVASFVETLADLNDNRKDDRHLLLAAMMTKDLRTKWSPLEFEQDKAQGYDYGPAKLATEAVKIGGGTTTYTATRVGDLPEFKVELTKPTGKKAFVVRLVKGPAPHEWLVSEVTEAKG